jgi:hypothetical protein
MSLRPGTYTLPADKVIEREGAILSSVYRPFPTWELPKRTRAEKFTASPLFILRVRLPNSLSR